MGNIRIPQHSATHSLLQNATLVRAGIPTSGFPVPRINNPPSNTLNFQQNNLETSPESSSTTREVTVNLTTKPTINTIYTGICEYTPVKSRILVRRVTSLFG